jgi:hypothetical protein
MFACPEYFKLFLIVHYPKLFPTRTRALLRRACSTTTAYLVAATG